MSSPRLQSVLKQLRCPHCDARPVLHGDRLECECGKRYPIVDGVLRFGEAEVQGRDAQFQQEEMRRSTWLGKLYHLGKSVLSSEYAPGHTLDRFLATLPSSALVVELGSGSRRLTPTILNIDLFPLPNVDIAADVHDVPLATDSVDHVILDSVLEHVADPSRLIGEIQRILKPGGSVLCIAPFLFPYHGYPAHYCNFSRDGLAQMFRDYSSCEINTHMGPTTAMINMSSEYFAVAMSGGAQNKLVYMGFKGLFLAPIFWLKYLDKIWVRSPHSHRLAGMLCAVATK